jgi:uncharacterized protein YndB with AHSA1/START domain
VTVGSAPMFTASKQITIERPIDEVFAVIGDARSRPKWDPSVDSEELTSPEPIGAGSTVRTKMRSMGRDYVLDWKITEHDPPNGQTIESTAGPFPSTLVWSLTDQGGSSTLAEFSITGRPGGLLRLMQPLISRGTQGNLDKAFPRLKRLLETGSAD